MTDLTLTLTSGTEVPITQHAGISVSEHNDRYAHVHINVDGREDDCVINEGEYWPLEPEISKLTGIKDINHYPRGERFGG